MNDVNTSAPTYTTWRYHTDPEYREQAIKKSVEYIKERRQRDAEFDERMRQHWREHAKKAAEKRAQDPELAAKRREYMRLYQQKKRAEKLAQATPVS